MNLLERIKLVVEEKSMTISELERRANLGNSSIRKWETTNPKTDKLQSVADVLGVSMDWLLGRTEVRYVSSPNSTIPQIKKFEINDLLETAVTNNGTALSDDEKKSAKEILQLYLKGR